MLIFDGGYLRSLDRPTPSEVPLFQCRNCQVLRLQFWLSPVVLHGLSVLPFVVMPSILRLGLLVVIDFAAKISSQDLFSLPSRSFVVSTSVCV